MAVRAKKPAKRSPEKKVIKEKVTAEGPVEIVVNVPEDMEVKNETTTTPDELEVQDTEKQEKSQVIVKKDEDSLEQNSEDSESEEVEKENSENSDKDGNDDDDEGISFKKILLWTVSIVLFFSAIGILGAFVYQLGFRTGEETMQKKMESMATPTPEATPTPQEVAKDEFTIEVLNGSGISGEAGKAQTLLEDEGFTVSGIGNADSSDFTETVISAKEGVSKDWLTALEKSLAKDYIASLGDELSDDAETDVVVTVGSSKSE